MIFRIQDTFRYMESSSLADVVYSVSYEFLDSGSSAVNGVLNKVKYQYNLQLDPVSSDNFQAYSSVSHSEDTFKSWVANKFGSGWGAHTASIEQKITDELNSKTSSQPTFQGYWGTGSCELSQVALDNGMAMDAVSLYVNQYSKRFTWDNSNVED